MRQIALLLLLTLLAGCASSPSTRKQDEVLYFYSGAIIWDQIDEALAFVDPEFLRENPMTAVERARYDQIEFAGYLVKGKEMVSEEELHQLVELRVVNRHTQTERVVMDKQVWRWDKEAKRWWLTSGLPDISGR
jgi:hypothetical protein